MNYEDIKSPIELKRLDISELRGVADYLRSRIISAVQVSGGHLSSNLGTVELTVALHYVFDCPHDKIIFDVGHQSYAHKILTGRGDKFDKLRKNDGISGFPKPDESEYDAFCAGHASTSLSVALGFAEAAKAKGEDMRAVAVIGDGALTGGMAYEAMNCIGSSRLPVMIVLNDNDMSISRNVGAMSNYLTRLRVSKKYARIKNEIKRAVETIPLFGDGALHLLDKGKKFFKRFVLSNKIFESMGISYYGPFDGHNIKELVEVFSRAKHYDKPVLVHVVTDKGHGLSSAAGDPEHSHGIAAIDAGNEKSFSKIFGDFLSDAAKQDDSIMAVTAAMAIGTGLEGFSKTFPDKFRDVGIAEEHAVTYCAALAAAGMKPYFGVYSTFLQRGFDQLVHDVGIGGYPVKLCIDRAGAIGSDGVTHQGLFDLSYLSLIPNMTVMCPTDGNELKSMLEFSLDFDKPLAIRYPKTYDVEREHENVVFGKWEYILSEKSDVYVLCVGGRALNVAERAATIEKQRNERKHVRFNIINARFVKPLDTELLQSINKSGNIIITVEDNSVRGGFGESVLSYLNGIGKKASVGIMAFPDEFIDNRDVADSFVQAGITSEKLIELVKKLD
ncbi:MAG: 1-deoxy-D-xylulose-5-phosphate synthase [Clostridiales bacterium]|nr:1-deoxy-D-xylulose-5-phosphate synthase [Clostridiales bacterium]